MTEVVAQSETLVPEKVAQREPIVRAVARASRLAFGLVALSAFTACERSTSDAVGSAASVAGHYSVSVGVPGAKDTLRIRGSMRLVASNDSTVEGDYELLDPQGSTGIATSGRVLPTVVAPNARLRLLLGTDAVRLDVRAEANDGNARGARLLTGELLSREFGEQRRLPISMARVRSLRTEPMVFALSYVRDNGRKEGRYDAVVYVDDVSANEIRLSGTMLQFERDTLDGPPFTRVANRTIRQSLLIDERGRITFDLPLGDLGLPLSCRADSLASDGIQGLCSFGNGPNSDIVFHMGVLSSTWEVVGYPVPADSDGDSLMTLLRPEVVGEVGLSIPVRHGTWLLFEPLTWPTKSGRIYEVVGDGLSYERIVGMPGVGDFGRSRDGGRFALVRRSVFAIRDSVATLIGQMAGDTSMFTTTWNRGAFAVIGGFLGAETNLAIVDRGQLITLPRPTLPPGYRWSVSSTFGGWPTADKVWTVFAGVRDTTKWTADTAIGGEFDLARNQWSLGPLPYRTRTELSAFDGLGGALVRADTLIRASRICLDSARSTYETPDRGGCLPSRVRTVVSRVAPRGRLLQDTVQANFETLHLTKDGALYAEGQWGGIFRLDRRFEPADTLVPPPATAGRSPSTPEWVRIDSRGISAMLANGILLRSRRPPADLGRNTSRAEGRN